MIVCIFIQISLFLPLAINKMAYSDSPSPFLASSSLLLFSMILFFVLRCSAEKNPPSTVEVSSYLDIQNAARKAVGVAPLVWNDTLASYAQNCANQVSKKKCSELLDCNLEEIYGMNYGIYEKPLQNIKTVAQSWVDEQKNCTHGNNLTLVVDLGCFAYTKLVWSKTTSVGCAESPCSTKPESVFVQCNYYPRGNIPGEKPF